MSSLVKAQKGDFLGMFIIDGKDVVVRLLDPPLHEFLDSPRELDVEIAHEEEQGKDAAAKRALLAKFDAFQEANSMLGLRGCLGLVYPELNVMQVRAIASAAAELKRVGLDPRPEIMVFWLASKRSSSRSVKIRLRSTIKVLLTSTVLSSTSQLVP